MGDFCDFCLYLMYDDIRTTVTIFCAWEEYRNCTLTFRTEQKYSVSCSSVKFSFILFRT